MTTTDRPDLDALGKLDAEMSAEDRRRMLAALPALIAYARRVEGERDALQADLDTAADDLTRFRMQYFTVADAIAPSSNNAHELADKVRAFRKRAEALDAELAAERDAHHQTCDALARERAEVGRLREGLEVQHMAEANRIAGAGGCCGGCDAAWLTAECERLRGLVERCCNALEEAEWGKAARRYREELNNVR